MPRFCQGGLFSASEPLVLITCVWGGCVCVQSLRLMMHRASEGGVSSSPLLRRARGDKQVEYLDLDLHTGHTTPPRQVRPLPPPLSLSVLKYSIYLQTNTSFNLKSPRKSETLHQRRRRRWRRAGQRRRGARTRQPRACGLRGGGSQEDQGPEKHQGSLARRTDVHGEGEQDVVAERDEGQRSREAAKDHGRL